MAFFTNPKVLASRPVIQSQFLVSYEEIAQNDHRFSKSYKGIRIVSEKPSKGKRPIGESTIEKADIHKKLHPMQQTFCPAASGALNKGMARPTLRKSLTRIDLFYQDFLCALCTIGERIANYVHTAQKTRHTLL